LLCVFISHDVLVLVVRNGVSFRGRSRCLLQCRKRW
jgi:hypothetical protein